ARHAFALLLHHDARLLAPALTDGGVDDVAEPAVGKTEIGAATAGEGQHTAARHLAPVRARRWVRQLWSARRPESVLPGPAIGRKIGRGTDRNDLLTRAAVEEDLLLCRAVGRGWFGGTRRRCQRAGGSDRHTAQSQSGVEGLRKLRHVVLPFATALRSTPP